MNPLFPTIIQQNKAFELLTIDCDCSFHSCKTPFLEGKNDRSTPLKLPMAQVSSILSCSLLLY